MDRSGWLPEGWRKRTLGELAQYINGRAFKPEDWATVGLPIVRIEQINNARAPFDCYVGWVADQNRIADGDLLFSWSATLTTLIWRRGPAVLNQHIFKVAPAKDTDLHFLHHLLDWLIGALVGQTHGSTMQHIKRSDLLPFATAVPVLYEQRRIAEILDTVDGAIQQTERLIEKLRAIKAGLLHDLLTLGLDENGRLRDPVAHPGQFKESEVGRIPREWTVGRISDLAINHDGQRIPLKEADRAKLRGIHPYYGASGIIDWVDRWLFDGDYVLLGEDGENVVSRRLPLALRVTGRFWANNHAHVYEPRPRTDVRFLESLLEATDYSSIIAGSAQPKLTQDGLSRLLFAVPGPSEQEAIAEVLEVHDARVGGEQSLCGKLKQLKKGLMHDLLTGQVRASFEAPDC